jgi:predicted histone-like DNA-binding protein
MAINFKMVPKKNILVSPPQIKYYPCAVHKGEEDLDSLAEKVASRSSMSKADCFGVIIGLTEVIAEALAEGRIVRIDSLGSFQITVQGTPADTLEELGKANIKSAKIKYNPSKRMKMKLDSLTYKRIR